jgi:hypothetical protein
MLLRWIEHVDQAAGGNQFFSGGFPGRPISRVLFPIGKRRFVAPVRQLLHGFFMRRSRHKRSDRLIVPPDRHVQNASPFVFLTLTPRFPGVRLACLIDRLVGGVGARGESVPGMSY